MPGVFFSSFASGGYFDQSGQGDGRQVTVFAVLGSFCFPQPPRNLPNPTNAWCIFLTLFLGEVAIFTSAGQGDAHLAAGFIGIAAFLIAAGSSILLSSTNAWCIFLNLEEGRYFFAVGQLGDGRQVTVFAAAGQVDELLALGFT